jgi:regulatory protein
MSFKPLSVRERAMNLLARREHSRHELAQKLILKGHFHEEIGPALDRLKDQGLLDDQRFSESYTRYRARLGFGPLRIRQELQKKGVNHAMIAHALSTMDDQWLSCLSGAWQKKFKGVRASDAAEHGKQYRFLLMRGYEPQQIHDLLQSGF